MLSWRRLAALGVLVSVTAGCRSAHLEDVYIARDEEGIRRTDCIQPQWQEYYLIMELLSFKDDTLVWPYLYCVSGDCFAISQALGRNDGLLAPPWQAGDESLIKFGNMAPGNTGANAQPLAITIQELEVAADGSTQPKDLTLGVYRWDIWIDEEDEPRESVFVTVDPGCPCVDAAIGNPGAPGCL